jgi:hypothetical protein
VYTEHYNIVSSLLLSKLIETFPTSPQNVDMLYPFMKVEKITVKDGYVELPSDYRNLLGNPSVSLRPDGKDCGENEITNEQQFKNATLKSGCKTRPVIIVSQSEWDYRTTSSYRFPTYDDPIGVMFGESKIKICPYDITKVEVRYARKENIYRYGYIMQPDDTYIFDKNTTIESEWTNAAYDKLYKGLCLLYGEYTRDNSLRDWTSILIQAGIL